MESYLNESDKEQHKEYELEIAENNEKIQKGIICMHHNRDNIEIIKVCNGYINDSLNVINRCNESIKSLYQWQDYLNYKKLIECTSVKRFIKDITINRIN